VRSQSKFAARSPQDTGGTRTEEECNYEVNTIAADTMVIRATLCSQARTVMLHDRSGRVQDQCEARPTIMIGSWSIMYLLLLWLLVPRTFVLVVGVSVAVVLSDRLTHALVA
jgi:hypothetical protein